MMPYRRQIRGLIAIIVGSTVLLAAITIFGFSTASSSAERDHKTLVKVDETQQLTSYNSARAECIREIGSKLDEARWRAVGTLISGHTNAERAVAGTDLLGLPNAFDLITKGGRINGEQIAPCPPVVVRIPTKGTP